MNCLGHLSFAMTALNIVSPKRASFLLLLLLAEELLGVLDERKTAATFATTDVRTEILFIIVLLSIATSSFCANHGLLNL